MKYTRRDYDNFMDDYNTTLKSVGTKIAICKVERVYDNNGFVGATMELLEVFDGDIFSYQDEVVLLVDPTDNRKGIEIIESIVYSTSEEFISEIGDVEMDDIDPRIFELDGKVDFFITSNEW